MIATLENRLLHLELSTLSIKKVNDLSLSLHALCDSDAGLRTTYSTNPPINHGANPSSVISGLNKKLHF